MARKTTAKSGKSKPPTKKQPAARKTRAGKAAPISSLKDFCRSLPGTTEDIKWGQDHIFSVGKKMYAGFGPEGDDSVGFKCDQQDQLRLIQIQGIIPAPYAARFGWVLVEDRRALTADELRKLLEKAHRLVLAGLPKRVQAEIAASRSSKGR